MATKFKYDGKHVAQVESALVHPTHADGLVDSTGMLEVIGFLEEEFGLKIEDNEVVPANLDSIGHIRAFVIRKQERAGGSA